MITSEGYNYNLDIRKEAINEEDDCIKCSLVISLAVGDDDYPVDFLDLAFDRRTHQYRVSSEIICASPVLIRDVLAFLNNTGSYASEAT